VTDRDAGAAPGDQVRVSVQVAVDVDEAFRIFTEEIDRWWRRGPRFRASGAAPGGLLHLEPRVGGRLFESFDGPAGPCVVTTGRVTAWEPPARLAFEWRGVNFGPSDTTEVDVRFEPRGDGTLVTVVHRGWSKLMPDHPVRHGLDVPAFIRSMGLWWGDLMTALRERAADTPT
jgi:uncharacterized protein YndB with AHSA1/START domain